MELKPAGELLPEDLPYVEPPFRAVSRLEVECRSLREFPLPPRQYWVRQGLNLSPELQRVHALRHVKDGSLLLVSQRHRPPLSPIVHWLPEVPSAGQQPGAPAGRWVFAEGLSFLLANRLQRQLTELNQSGQPPEHFLREANGYPDRYTRRPLTVSAGGARDEPEPVRPARLAAAAPTPPRRPLQIGVFFDGTGNHKDNDRTLTDRDVTNIAKLHDLYPDERPLYIRRIYIHGPGTIDGVQQTPNGLKAKESSIGLASATGPEGGQARIWLTEERLERILREHPDIDRITFDVFGFSRGAALARHFVNLIHSGLRGVGIPADVVLEVRFLGLFDTVGSFFWPGDSDDGHFNLNLHGGSAQRVVHYTARHEIRFNFPLSSLQDGNGRMPGNFSEIVLPGVHADIGGGYENPDKDFANVEKLPVRLLPNLALAGGEAIRLAQADAAKYGRHIQVQYPDVVEVEHRHTRKELALVALHKMHEQAKAAGAPLRGLPLGDPDYTLPPALEQAWQRWQAAGGAMNLARRFLGQYIHTSHREPLGSQGVVRDLENYAHRPEPSGIRRILFNNPAWAVGGRRQAAHAQA